MEVILEILKYTIPALIVFLSSYFIHRQYLNNQYHLQSLELKARYSKEAIPLKLQAYERLILFCDRISIPSLIMRLKTQEMRSVELKDVMMIATQKEFEHNIAQQLYTSKKLWEIISLAKNDIINFVEVHAKQCSSDASANELAQILLREYNQLKSKPAELAIQAIKEEAKIILNV